jgi:hypothetical protein
VRLTLRAAVAALAATLVAAVAWPEGAEKVGRAALLVVGAAFVTDLVLALRRAVPPERSSPFTPPPVTATPPSLPKGLVDLQREVRLLTVDANALRLPVSTRLRVTARAAAQARLHRAGLDLDDPSDADAARHLLGEGPYDYVTGAARTVPPDELLIALEAQ